MAAVGAANHALLILTSGQLFVREQPGRHDGNLAATKAQALPIGDLRHAFAGEQQRP